MQFYAVTHYMPSETLISYFKYAEIILNLFRLFSSNSDPRGRAVYGIGLRPLTDGLRVRIPQGAWMSHVSVVYCQVEVSTTGWPLIQMSPNVCGVSEYDRETLIMKGSWPTTGCCAVTKKNYFQYHVLSFMPFAKHIWKRHKVLQSKTWR
jgi:hypothetical protein